ncbi:MAG: response regulator [Candidatus Margulisbacteria bacterium]|nr:response regulator [Candidatus Margulisiibacteriota bacterium]
MAKKILIVDDDRDYVEATKTLLESKGYSTVFAYNGEEGFEKAKTEKPDLILLDVMMTNKTEGFDISRSIKEEESIKNTPVFVITGIRKDMKLPFKFEPDEDFLPVKKVMEKPIKPNDLLKAIEEVIG